LCLPSLPWPTHQLVICPVPTIHISHVNHPLTTGQLNTAIQVNNMGARHLMYNGHTVYMVIQRFPYTSSILLGRPAGAMTFSPPAFRPPIQFFFSLGVPIDPQRAV
jgi:hypothetical protein